MSDKQLTFADVPVGALFRTAGGNVLRRVVPLLHAEAAAEIRKNGQSDKPARYNAVRESDGAKFLLYSTQPIDGLVETEKVEA